MTIYSDNAGNHFLGDCIFANHSISYPSVNFLQAHPHSSISAELTALLTASGLQFRNVLSQSDFNNTGQINKSLFAFAPSSDTIDDRYVLGIERFFSGGFSFSALTASLHGSLSIYNNSGYTSTTNSPVSTNRLLMFGSINSLVDNVTFTGGSGFTFVDVLGFQDPNTVSGMSPVSWVGVSDGESLGLFIYQHRLGTDRVLSRFYYFGIVDSVNTNFNYYSQDIVSKSILLCGGSGDNNTSESTGSIPTPCDDYISGAHRIGNTNKIILKTGDAIYPIVCSDGQTPTAQWATDFYVFDNNSTLGFPAMGRVRNLLLAQGTYTTGKPVRIQGTVQPDNGFNCWLPVGTFAGKTVLMRCYSSVSL